MIGVVVCCLLFAVCCLLFVVCSWLLLLVVSVVCCGLTLCDVCCLLLFVVAVV